MKAVVEVGRQSATRLRLFKLLWTIHDAVFLFYNLKRVDPTPNTGVPRPGRTFQMSTMPIPLNRMARKRQATWARGTIIRRQQGLHQKGDAVGLARCFAACVFHKEGIVSKASRQGFRLAFRTSIQSLPPGDGLGDGAEGRQTDQSGLQAWLPDRTRWVPIGVRRCLP